MSHQHCHCGLKSQIAKFKAGKLGIFGGILIIGHLLFHVAECLLLPAILMAWHGDSAEATELSEEDFVELTFDNTFTPGNNFQMSFQDSLQKYALHKQPSSSALDALT